MSYENPRERDPRFPERPTSGLTELQQALPTWVRLERHQGQPVISSHQTGDLAVVEVYDYPEAPPNAVRADVHFVEVAPTEGFPAHEVLVQTVRAALGPGEFGVTTAADLAGGPSYITLGGWLGSQDLALMLIGAVELAGIAKAITPGALGMKGEVADALAGRGLVMLGPWRGWDHNDQ